jgi:hypothetical protein
MTSSRRWDYTEKRRTVEDRMEMPLHQLRRMSPGIGRFLLPILLLSWLSAFCASCFALAEAANQVSESVSPCHTRATPIEAHDCCESSDACLGDACLEAEPPLLAQAAALLEVPSLDLPVLASEHHSPPPRKPPPSLVPAGPLVGAPSVPTYLRCCRFLN